MASLSYTVTEAIKGCLAKVDLFRQEILLAPIPNEMLLNLQWKATTAQGFKEAFSYIKQEWTGSKLTVNPKSLVKLEEILRISDVNTPKFSQVLDYVNSSNSHPILQSGIINLHFYPSPLAVLIPQIYLCKSGYDCRNTISIDDFWHKNTDTYHSMLEKNQNTVSITPWLEFYCQAAVYEYGLIHRSLFGVQVEPSNKLLWQITDRQKQILSILEVPGSSLTNRKVQALFNISQVTASRDLSQMANVGLLFPHGHGRSVYYTRV